MTSGQKTGLISVIVIAIIGASIALFRYMKPGVYAPYKCNSDGDDTRKFYDPNWQARGAVCDGFYIPFGSKLNGKAFDKVLARMAAIQTTKPTTTADMKKLAELAAKTA